MPRPKVGEQFNPHDFFFSEGASPEEKLRVWLNHQPEAQLRQKYIDMMEQLLSKLTLFQAHKLMDNILTFDGTDEECAAAITAFLESRRLMKIAMGG